MRDMIQIARRRYPGVRLVLYPALVQGPEAADTIVSGIRTLDAMPEVDTIIVGRGGGSIEDLWPFNEEKVALAIAQAKTPVVSAVGHETDFTIADFVSDLRAPTPSAAAELTVPDVRGVLEELQSWKLRQQKAVQGQLTLCRQQLMLYGHRLQAVDPHRRVDEYRQQLDMLSQRRQHQCRQSMQTWQHRLDKLGSALELLSPQHQLGKGYALLVDEAGHSISSRRQVQTGQKIRAVLQDGALTATVDAVEEQEE